MMFRGFARRLIVLAGLALAAAGLAGCSLFPRFGPPASPGLTPPPTTMSLATMTTGQRAAVFALLANPLFTSGAIGDGGITPYDESAIGQANWYQIDLRGGGVVVVTARLGWGDCPAGCISEHRYAYTVAGDIVTGVVETGDPLPDVSNGNGAELSSLTVTASAGPTCPVERFPPDPACAPRPVAGASITAIPFSGKTVSGITDASGRATLALPAGVWLVSAEASVGLPGHANPAAVIATGTSGAEDLTLSFDTGIR